jgi:hypothetical protein
LHICLRHQRAAYPFHVDPRVGIARLILIGASVVVQATCHAESCLALTQRAAAPWCLTNAAAPSPRNCYPQLIWLRHTTVSVVRRSPTFCFSILRFFVVDRIDNTYFCCFSTPPLRAALFAAQSTRPSADDGALPPERIAAPSESHRSA